MRYHPTHRHEPVWRDTVGGSGPRVRDRQAGREYDPTTGALVREWIRERETGGEPLGLPRSPSRLPHLLASVGRWLTNWTLAVLLLSGVLLVVVIGWTLAERAVGTGWPGMLAAIALAAGLCASGMGADS